MTTEAVAVGLITVLLAACSFVAGLRRPRAGRLATTVIVSVVAGSTIALAVATLVIGDPGNPDSIAVPLGAFFLLVGLLIAGAAVLVRFGREVGRWLAAAILGLLGGLVLWGTVSHPVERDTAIGSIVVLLIGLGFVACTSLLAGGSNAAARWAGRPSADARTPASLSQTR